MLSMNIVSYWQRKNENHLTIWKKYRQFLTATEQYEGNEYEYSDNITTHFWSYGFELIYYANPSGSMTAREIMEEQAEFESKGIDVFSWAFYIYDAETGSYTNERVFLAIQSKTHLKSS